MCIFFLKSCPILGTTKDSYILINKLVTDTLSQVYQHPVITYTKKAKEHREADFGGVF